MHERLNGASSWEEVEENTLNNAKATIESSEVPNESLSTARNVEYVS
jgi:hypothetical protein